MRKRFRDTEEHQADAHAGAEHHGDPADGSELGLLTVFAQRNVAESTDSEVDGKQHESRSCEYEEPADVRHQPAENTSGYRVQVVGSYETPHDNSQHRCGRHGKHHVVGPNAYPSKARLRALFVGPGILFGSIRFRHHR